MDAISPFEVRKKLESIGKEALLKEIQRYNHLAQEFYYKTIVEIENEQLEKYKVALQEDANKLASGANRKAVWAIFISLLACVVSAAATIYAAAIK